MIPSKVKAHVLAFSLLSLFFLTLNCVSSKQIHPQDVYIHPNADFSKYKRIAIFLDFNQLPEERREGILFILLKEELEKRGYDILSNAFSVKNLSEPKKISDMRDELNISAIVKISVEKYEFKKKKQSAEKFFSRDYSSDGTRKPDWYTTEYYFIYILDFSLTLVMIETEQGNKVWSSSISCEKKEVEGSRHEFIRQMINNCLRTIPNK